ncbi:hypothetical protein BDM02DRAFT_3107884 [Thelephora ganbajun]|uniref:Uncharacterized protein n=1 Tax=Thelephora ganbajun TaxID=370292 RepID=A0ACB6ZV33_THEGA|nr:hypothetical protein BDM02DRAFT_3107884 [Thelephora ganbajun]
MATNAAIARTRTVGQIWRIAVGTVLTLVTVVTLSSVLDRCSGIRTGRNRERLVPTTSPSRPHQMVNTNR